MEGRRIGPAAAAATTPRTTETMPRTPSPQYRRAYSRPDQEAAKEKYFISSSTVVVAVSILSTGLVVLALVMIMNITRIRKLNTSVKKLSTQQQAAITKNDLDVQMEMVAYTTEDKLKENFDRAMRALRDEQQALRQVQRILLQRTNTTEDTKPTKLAQPASASSASQDTASCKLCGEHEMGEGSDAIMPSTSGGDPFEYHRAFPLPSALATG